MRSALVASAAFAVLAVLVALGATRSADQSVLDAVQSIASPPLDLASSLVTILGSTEVGIILALALAVVWLRREGARGLVPLLLFVGIAIELALKRLVSHPGPPDALSRGIEFLPLVRAGGLNAFPSGHLVRTTFLALLIAERAPAWRPLLWLLILAMAFTRLYLAAHWASDVLGGFLLGWALAAVASALRRR